MYEGKAEKLTQPTEASHEIIYTVTADDVTFALSEKRKTQPCGYTLIQTEHPKLFILEGGNDSFFKKRTSMNPQNVDIFTYMNSKFVYVEKHLGDK